VRVVRASDHTERCARSDARYRAADQPVRKEQRTRFNSLLTFLRALWPLRTRWPRSHATPRANPATLRRALRRAIRDELRASGLHTPRAASDISH